jgi:DNA-binding LacI/PurR family transcriptional regulator
VVALAEELGWRPNVRARSLSRARADAVGLLLPRGPEDVGAEPYYMALLAGIESGLAEAGTALMLRFVPGHDDGDLTVYREWHAEHRVDGVFLTDLRFDDPRPALLEQLGLPYLVHGGRRADTGWRFGQEQEAELLVAHLAQLGHRSLLHVAGPRTLVHEEERHRAVAAACAAADIALTTATADYTHAGATAAVRTALASGAPATAVLCSNDPMAVGALTALRGLGLDRLTALVSWDDSVLCETATPAITAVQRRPYDAGLASARLLLAGLRGETPVPDPIPFRLVARETSVPAS